MWFGVWVVFGIELNWLEDVEIFGGKFVLFPPGIALTREFSVVFVFDFFDAQRV